MDNDTIIKKAVEKAEKNGYVDTSFSGHCPICNQTFMGIFSHDFAKAFWGEKDMWKETPCDCGGVDFHIAGPDAHKAGGTGFDGKPQIVCAKINCNRGYQFHLKEMVVEEDPIKYLEKYL